MRIPETIEELQQLGTDILRIMRDTRSVDKNDKESHINTEILAVASNLLCYNIQILRGIIK